MYNVVDNISDAVIIIDTEGQILFLNASAKKIQNLHNPPLRVGGNLLDSVRLQWKEIVKTIIRRIELSKASSSLEADYVIDGKDVFFDVRCCPLYGTDGNLDKIMF